MGSSHPATYRYMQWYVVFFPPAKRSWDPCSMAGINLSQSLVHSDALEAGPWTLAERSTSLNICCISYVSLLRSLLLLRYISFASAFSRPLFSSGPPHLPQITKQQYTF